MQRRSITIQRRIYVEGGTRIPTLLMLEKYANALGKHIEVGKQESSTWKFIKGSIADKALIDRIFAEDKPAVVVNLAAQAGVR